MSIRLEWDNSEKTILRHVYEGTWTLEEYYDLIESNYQAIEAVGHPVYIINDLRHMADMPQDVVVAVRRAASRTHPNEILNVIVGASLYVNLLIETIHRAVGTGGLRLNHVATMEEAYKLIEAHRQTHS